MLNDEMNAKEELERIQERLQLEERKIALYMNDSSTPFTEMDAWTPEKINEEYCRMIALNKGNELSNFVAQT